MGPIAVVCLMLLWPLLGWAEKASPHSYKSGSQTCLYDGKEQIIIPGDLPIHQLSAYVVDCLNRSGEVSKAQDVKTDAILTKEEIEQRLAAAMRDVQAGGAPPANTTELAIQTAKMVGFERVVSSRPRPNHPHIKYIDDFSDAPLTAKCFPYPTDTEAPFPSVSCQVYAGQTGKILNLECRKDLQQCMVTGVLDIHQ